MEVLENVGIGIVLILILVFGVYFTMIGLIFVFGLPQLYSNLMLRLGRRLERKFPKWANAKGVKTGLLLLLIFSGFAVFVGAITFWVRLIEWLP